MIERETRNGPIIVRCDGCAPEFIETGEAKFDAAVAVAKAAGWRATYEGPGHGWCHWCPDCATVRPDARGPR